LQAVTSAQVTESHDYNALWLWVKAHRAEVASLAEAQLGIQSAGMNLSLQSPSLKVTEKIPDRPSGSSVLKSALQYAHTSDTPSPPKLSLYDGLTPTPFPTQTAQLSALPVSSPVLADKQSAGMNLSLQSPSLKVTDKTPDNTSGSSVLKSALQYAHTPDTPSPPKLSLHDGLTPTPFLTQPTQLSALPVSSPALALSPACQCEFETLFFYTLPI
jgi:hypothetical protein